MQINLFESIRIFIEIVESGSLSRAAENLQIHRPAVTKALQLLGSTAARVCCSEQRVGLA